MSALLTGEEGEITLGKPEFLHILYRLGMRMMTLTWNHENSLGYPNKQEKGLKEHQAKFDIPAEALLSLIARYQI